MDFQIRLWGRVGTMSLHKTADSRCWRHSEVICYIVIFGKVPLLCDSGKYGLGVWGLLEPSPLQEHLPTDLSVGLCAYICAACLLVQQCVRHVPGCLPVVAYPEVCVVALAQSKWSMSYLPEASQNPFNFPVSLLLALELGPQASSTSLTALWPWPTSGFGNPRTDDSSLLFVVLELTLPQVQPLSGTLLLWQLIVQAFCITKKHVRP